MPSSPGNRKSAGRGADPDILAAWQLRAYKVLGDRADRDAGADNAVPLDPRPQR
jgi:hypothetical protein